MTQEKAESSGFDIYWRLLQYLKGLLLPFLLSIVGFIMFAASQPMMAKLMEEIVNALQSGNSSQRYTLPLIAIAIFIIRGLSSFIGEYYNAYVGESVVRNIKLELFKHLTKLPASFYDNETQGVILHRLNSGVKKVKASVTNALKILIRDGLTVIALLAYVFYLNWQMSITFLIVAPVLALLVSYTAKKFRKITRKNENTLGKAMQISKELVSNYSVIRGFGAEEYEIARYQKRLDSTYKADLKIKKISTIFSPLSQIIVSIAVAGIVFMILDPAILEKHTSGELVGYLTAIGLIPKPLRQLTGVSVVIQKGIVGGELVFELLDTETEKDQGQYAPESITGKVDVQNLSFTYPNTETEVLRNISFTVNEGEMVAFVGASGSGKSTLVSLLCRHYDSKSGCIFLNDTDINDYQLVNLRHHISVVNQNVAMFDDTVRNNIGYGDNYSDDEIIKALKLADAYDFIQELPDGLDTNVGDNGLKFSGGQRQRLSIARAILKNSPVLILDEATSSLDNKSENIVTNAIEKLAKSRTTIVIAHRLSTILKADKLLVLKEGKIVESGTHQALLSKGGYYSELFHTELDKV